MKKRLEKRHRRQVARMRERVKFSEPDVRTPGELAAAPVASRAVGGRGMKRRLNYATPAANRGGVCGRAVNSDQADDTCFCRARFRRLPALQIHRF